MTLIGGVRGIRDGLEAELPQVIAREADRFSVPGIAVAIVSGDNELTATSGVTSVENPVPVDADTLFKIASITKPITGTALMRLAELGRLDFDAPLRTYLPELRLADGEAAAGVTMRHVVTHRVGLMSRSKDFGPGDDALAKWTAHLVDLPQRARLGELFCYSWDFQLTGRVIEVLTGKTYEDAIHDLVLEPLGMTRSCFFARDAITYRVAAGHDVTDGGPHVARPWPEVRSGHPSGGLSSTANDLIRFMRLHLTRDAGADRPISGESVAFMASAVSPDGTHGVTWWRHHVNGLEVIEHCGGYPGFLAQLVLVPGRKFGISVLTNITRSGYEHRVPEINTVSGKIVKWAFDAYLDLRIPPDAPLSLSDRDLAAYAGTYLGEFGEVDISVGDSCLVATERPNDLSAAAPDPYHLAFYADDRFFRSDGVGKDTRGQFVRDARGEVAWFRPFIADVYRRNREGLVNKLP